MCYKTAHDLKSFLLDFLDTNDESCVSHPFFYINYAEWTAEHVSGLQKRHTKTEVVPNQKYPKSPKRISPTENTNGTSSSAFQVGLRSSVVGFDNGMLIVKSKIYSGSLGHCFTEQVKPYQDMHI